MGEVYRAHDEQLDRDVALKVLLSRSFEDSNARARLLREARAAAALNHPSICTIHEVGEADGQAYIAMEFVEGRPLSDRPPGHEMPATEVLRYGIQIADALAHAHARRVVHRDLKSANIVVTPDGRAKVLDFGLAKRVSGLELAQVTTHEQAPDTLTEAGTLVGTLAYMAPEQLRGAPADFRSDLWALGVVLYELASGKRPFQGQSAFELSSSILSQPPSPCPPTVPVAMRAVIERCLEKDASRRYQTATELRTALEAIQAGPARYGAALGYRLTRRPWLPVAAGVLIVAGAVAALDIQRVRMLWPGREPRIESLAVLPLENLSGDATQDYFADGMTELLSTDLARLGGLRRVTARSWVMRYKGTSSHPGEIARELNVDALVTGSVLYSGDRVSITAQLLDPSTGAQLWTNRYDRNLQDVLVLRNEIVSAIVGEINAQLSPDDQARLASARQVDPQAFEAYLKGRFEWFKQTREAYDLAERYFQLAVEREPTYALGYAGLASVWFMRAEAGFRPPSESFRAPESSWTRPWPWTPTCRSCTWHSPTTG